MGKLKVGKDGLTAQQRKLLKKLPKSGSLKIPAGAGKSRSILYGQVHPRSDFDKITRLKGTQTRIAQAGSEFFLLDTYFRVIGIFKTYEKAKSAYRPAGYGSYGRYLHLTLEKITQANQGRCSAATCKRIFDDLKTNSGRQIKKYGETFLHNGVKYKVTQVRSVYYYATDPSGREWRIRISNVV